MQISLFRYLNLRINSSSSCKTICLLTVRVWLSTRCNNRKTRYDHDASICDIACCELGLFIFNIVQEPSFHGIGDELFPCVRIESTKALLYRHNIIIFKAMNNIQQPLILITRWIRARSSYNNPRYHLQVVSQNFNFIFISFLTANFSSCLRCVNKLLIQRVHI